MAFKIKPGHETITKTFRLPIEICGQLEQLAFNNNLSLNAVVVQCSNMHLKIFQMIPNWINKIFIRYNYIL